MKLAPNHADEVETFVDAGGFDATRFPDGDFGYTPNVEETERFVEEQALRTFGESRWYGDMRAEKRDAFLWLPLLEYLPNWLRGNQGIGDCVSWGWELGGTLFIYGERKLGLVDFPLVTGATEAIYGGSRVESRGGKLGGYRDGSYGGAAARWLTEWGFLLRLDYSKDTGVAEHNLTEYSSKKAKAWGNFGCGGADDEGREKGLLDQQAALYPMTTTAIRTTEELAAALMNGYPCPTCSGIGYGNKGKFHSARNADGVVRISGGWNHCELFCGVRWVNGRPQFRLANSWGKCASGPDPGIDDPAMSYCSWWVTEEDAQRQLNARDTFAITGSEGFVPRKLDWTDVRTAGNSDRVPGGPRWV